MRNAKWPLRLAIVLSAIWAIIAYSISYENGRLSGGTFAAVGLIPLGVLWGMGWVLAGVFSQRAERTKIVMPTAPAEPSFSTPVNAMPADALPATLPARDATESTVDWEPSVAVEPLAGPWRRFFARTLDLYVWTIVVGFVVGILNLKFGWSLLDFGNMPASSQDTLSGILMIPFALVLDALVYAAFGNTLGKGLLGVKVETLSGEPLPARSYVARNAYVWIFGLGLGIPIVALFTEIASYRTVAKGERTRWDLRYGCRVPKAPRRIGHYLVAVALFVAFIAVLGYGKMMEQNQVTAQNQPPVTWQNPITQKTAVILPAGWRLLPTSTKLPPNTYLYVDSTNQFVLGIGFEETDASLEDYAQALLVGNPTLALIRDGAVTTDSARQVWTGSGSGVASGMKDAMTVHAHVFAGDRGYWRVFEAGPEGREETSAQEVAVYQTVLQTLMP
ncbi:RDD family protein [Paraburkholderia sediminicola]|uniref:RDD family protein n=1 Tax=Paraburkholderia sediminicola TaxID=458836 RepID=UPI0038BC78D7